MTKQTKGLVPPIAKKQPKELIKHNDVRVDNYYWLNERENEDVISYLNDENTYTDGMLSHTEAFQKSLFEEMKARIKEDDASVPYKFNGYWYVTRFEKGQDYPIYTRKKETLEAEEEILFNCNEMAKGCTYFKLGSFSISPDNTKVAFTTDKVSRRQYTLQVKDLVTKEIFKDNIENTTGSCTWANDNETIFYTKKDAVTLRSDKVFKHQLNTEAKADVLVYFEEDETFNTFVYKSKSRKYLIIGSSSTTTSEYRFVDANTPHGEFKVFQERVRDLEYSIAHYQEHFYIITNKDGATNFKLQKTLETQTEQSNWEDVLPYRADVLIEDIEIFADYLVINERKQGLNQLRIIAWNGNEDYYLPFDGETYTAYVGNNPDFDSDNLRYGFNSLTNPSSVMEYNLKTKAKTVLKEQHVLGDFDKTKYDSKRLWASARDGKKVPMSVVFKKGLDLNGENPVLQYAYGSYGSTIDPYFSSVRLSLLDRGFVYAICHIRGGEYLGRDWYEDGKMLHKMNTFTDFIDCSKFLIEANYTSAKHLYAMGGSAGGLLMGTVMNLNPELYNGVIAAVPFVDVVTTMLDDTIPLTTGEYDEWGNPNEKTYYDYMKSYSPYDNVVAQNYPNTLITTGLHDSQVQYWEPAKWIAKLRDLKTDENILVMKTDMTAGHGGASGRFEALKDVALEYAFLLDLENITE